MLALTGSAAYPEGYADRAEYIADLSNLSGIESIPVLYNAKRALGQNGIVLVGIAAFSAVSTGVLGFHRSAARVLNVMAKEKLLPKRFAEVNKHGLPVNASLLIMLVSLPIPFLGRTALGWNADVSTLSVAIVYAYVSICAFMTADGKKRTGTRAVGVAGIVSSALVFLFLLIPNVFAHNALAKESYFLLAVWSMTGMLYYWFVFRRDRDNRFGRSAIMWIMMLFLQFFSINVWTRMQMQERIESGTGNTDNILINGSIVQIIVIAAALVIMYNLFVTMLKRQKELNLKIVQVEERDKAKSEFLSNMSHDIRTPMISTPAMLSQIC